MTETNVTFSSLECRVSTFWLSQRKLWRGTRKQCRRGICALILNASTSLQRTGANEESGKTSARHQIQMAHVKKMFDQIKIFVLEVLFLCPGLLFRSETVNTDSLEVHECLLSNTHYVVWIYKVVKLEGLLNSDPAKKQYDTPSTV